MNIIKKQQYDTKNLKNKIIPFINKWTNIALSESNFNKEVNIIKKIAINDEYDTKLIDNILIKDPNITFSSLRYFGRTTHKI